MDWIGVEMDHARNEGNAMIVSTDLSRARVFVVPTDEEIVMARAAWRLLDGSQRAGELAGTDA
jgi:acetate kinase